MTLIHSARRGGSMLRGALVAAAITTASLTGATAAHAAGTQFRFEYSTYPGDYGWDGGGVAPPPSSGDYSVSAYQPYAADKSALCGVDGCDDQQLRAGAVLPDYDAATSTGLPVTLAPGDVLQTINLTTKAAVAATTVVAPQPVISSVVGTPNFTIARTAATTGLGVSLMRRVARPVDRDTIVPGTYHYEQDDTAYGSDDGLSTCSAYDPSTRRYVSSTDVAPAKPTTPALPAGKSWFLVRDTSCSRKTVQIPGNPYEFVSSGRLTALTDTSFSGVFAVPMLAGDLISYTESTDSIANDVETDISQNNVAPVGVVPPAPIVKTFDFGASTTTIKAFLKGGLRTFVQLDSAATVTEQLTVPAPKVKKAKGKKKKATAKLPIVVGVGTATTTAPSQTVKVVIYSTKDGRKALRALKGKPAKTTLTTTITDAFGHSVVSTAKVKLSGK